MERQHLAGLSCFVRRTEQVEWGALSRSSNSPWRPAAAVPGAAGMRIRTCSRPARSSLQKSLSPRSSASRSFQDISLLRGWTTDGACESRPTLYLRAARACFPWPTRVSSCVCGRRFESPGTATVQTVSGPSTAWDARSGLRKQPWAFGDSLAQSLAVPGSWTPVVGWAAIGGRPGGAAVRHAVVRHGVACPELPGLLREPERLSLSLGRELAWRTPSFLLAAALSGLVGEAPGFSGWGVAEREGLVP